MSDKSGRVVENQSTRLMEKKEIEKTDRRDRVKIYGRIRGEDK
jgi:hypothetical protein